MTQSSDIVALLAAEIRRLVPAAAEIDLTPDQPLITSGLLDSLTLFRLITAIQRQFQVKIRPKEIVVENFADISSIARLIEAKRGESDGSQPA